MKRQCNTFQKLLLFVFVFWSSLLLYAQQYPVQVTPVLFPPYSLQLSDYATTTENKLQVQLLMKDLMEPSHRIKIKFSLESGVNSTTVVQNNTFINGFQEITLYPGTPVLLTNIDLRPLFQLENLTGINAANYARPLPEGMYKFSFQVFDAATGRALSAKSSAIAYLVQYEPPILNLPQQGEKILKSGEFQNIIFQWMPRQVAPNTRYIFTLKELWDNQRDPVSGFLASRILWQEETYAPTLYYGIDKTALIPGKRYAWQVQAKSGNPVVGNSPTQDNGVYKNNGLSEIFYFDYTENCIVPILLTAKNVGRGKTEIRWVIPGNSSGNLYRIQYRRKGSTAEWTQQESYQDMCILSGLKDETEYEYRIGSVCGNLYQADYTTDNAYAFSGIQTFITNNKETANNNIQCGILPQVDISNKSPLQTELGTNEVFMAGDFPVTVLQSQGSNGNYSGYGYIEVSYLADTKIKVTFNNIKLNTDKQLIGGILETTYDINESSLTHISQGIGETFGDRGVEPIIVDYVISDVEYIATPPPGKIIITGNSGKGNANDTGSGESSRQELPAGKDYAITDKEGNVWHVDEEGNITKGEKIADGGASNAQNTEGVTGSGSNAQVTQYTAKGLKVEWHETAETRYAYDTADKFPALKDIYPTVEDSDGNKVSVAYKAVVNKSNDTFGAKITFTDNTLKDQKIIFKTLKIGQEIPAQKGADNDYTLTLTGSMNYAEEDVIAVLMPKDSTEKQQIIGSFKLVHLEPKVINVALVPTDEVSKGKLGNIIEQTNEIYSKVGVTINFVEDGIFDIAPYLEKNQSIPTEKNSLLSTYSSVQQAINKAYGERNSERYVLFVTDKQSSTGQMGYMRLGGQFGYIFKSPTGKTVAHELGHGVFQLEHSWDKYKTAESSTNLLMDYSNGTLLNHLDWKQINDPALKFHFFQKQEQGEQQKTLEDYIKTNNITEFIYSMPCQNDGIPWKTIFYGRMQAGKLIIDKEIPQLIKSEISKIDNLQNANLLYKTSKGWKVSYKSRFDSFSNISCQGIKVDDHLRRRIHEEFITLKPSDLNLTSEEYNNLLNNLKSIKKDSRTNQDIELEHWDKSLNNNKGGFRYFSLKNGSELEEVKQSLSDKQINEGKWTDLNIDTKIRYTVNNNGIIQIKAFGFRQNLKLAKGKSANLTSLAEHIKNKTNKFFLEQDVKKFDEKSPLFKDDSETFADGQKIEIGGNNSSYIKIISEGIGLTTTLLKTAKIEQDTYLEQPKGKPVIKIPGVGTGTVEAVVKSVTDITEPIAMVYDIAVDENVRTETYEGLLQIKDQIKNEPSQLFPILGEIILEEATGNTSEEWQEVTRGNTDAGKTSHLLTKGTVRTVATVFASGKLLAKLPKMADDIANKMGNIQKLRSQIDNIFNKSDNLVARKEKMIKFFEGLDPSFIDEIIDIENFDKVVKEMALSWKKFHGEKFMFENLQNSRRSLIKQIDKFEATFDDFGNYAADIRIKPSVTNPNGYLLEYKSWKKSSFKTLLNGDQAKNQLKAYIRSENFEYIVDKQKLIKDGVSDPTKFVREQFQDVFKKNTKELFDQNENFFKQFERVGGGNVRNYGDFDKLVKDPRFLDQIGTFVKVE